MRRRAGLGGVRSGAVGFGCSQARCPSGPWHCAHGRGLRPFASLVLVFSAS